MIDRHPNIFTKTPNLEIIVIIKKEKNRLTHYYTHINGMEIIN
jgi:hypothetical protein